jgi:hypothetical protein
MLQEKLYNFFISQLSFYIYNENHGLQYTHYSKNGHFIDEREIGCQDFASFKPKSMNLQGWSLY